MPDQPANRQVLPSLAAVHYERRFDIDGLLVEVSEALTNQGLKLGGLLQVSRGGVGGCATSVHVVDLRTRESFDIWEDRGACARGCRLDEGALLEAARVIDRAIEDRVDLVILNRFGRAESLGKGLINSFSEALGSGVPVLTAVREPYCAAWRAFHGGMATDLPADRASVISWGLRGGVQSPTGTISQPRQIGSSTTA